MSLKRLISGGRKKWNDGNICFGKEKGKEKRKKRYSFGTPCSLFYLFERHIHQAIGSQRQLGSFFSPSGFKTPTDPLLLLRRKSPSPFLFLFFLYGYEHPKCKKAFHR
eukprot:TRINITY_DN422_c7_g1_i1.p1 TRINITY_DN422_c7_g1~~TRINITY_DN422_c7_g1_i1.p1  ORF type:complete len:108 (-),score=5.12 TRINITY_DN422_c7_g1_i1:255-578(-)